MLIIRCISPAIAASDVCPKGVVALMYATKVAVCFSVGGPWKRRAARVFTMAAGSLRKATGASFCRSGFSVGTAGPGRGLGNFRAFLVEHGRGGMQRGGAQECAGEIIACQQRGSADPRLAAVPALDARRIERQPGPSAAETLATARGRAG